VDGNPWKQIPLVGKLRGMPKKTKLPALIFQASDPDPVVLLTKAQAQKLVDQVNRHFDDARALLLELEEKEGWRALGYDSWRSCAIAEFGKSASRVYQLVDAARVERNISTISRLSRIIATPPNDNVYLASSQ
jgi:hypothetical protein